MKSLNTMNLWSPNPYQRNLGPTMPNPYEMNMVPNPYEMNQFNNQFPMNQVPSQPLQQPQHMAQLKQLTLTTVEPIVQHGIREAQYTSVPHAMRETAAITYLIGRGYDPQTAHQMVESWEVNEQF